MGYVSFMIFRISLEPYLATKKYYLPQHGIMYANFRHQMTLKLSWDSVEPLFSCQWAWKSFPARDLHTLLVNQSCSPPPTTCRGESCQGCGCNPNPSGTRPAKKTHWRDATLRMPLPSYDRRLREMTSAWTWQAFQYQYQSQSPLPTPTSFPTEVKNSPEYRGKDSGKSAWSDGG